MEMNKLYFSARASSCACNKPDTEKQICVNTRERERIKNRARRDVEQRKRAPQMKIFASVKTGVL